MVLDAPLFRAKEIVQLTSRHSTRVADRDAEVLAGMIQTRTPIGDNIASTWHSQDDASHLVTGPAGSTVGYG